MRTKNSITKLFQDELKHYGVKGMHWGQRNYQNTDGTWTEAGKLRRRGAYKKSALVEAKFKKKVPAYKFLNKNHAPDNEGLSLPKGSKVNHVTPKDFKKLKKGQDLYVSATDTDRDIYRSFLTLMLEKKGYGKETPIKEVEMTLKRDLRAPSNKAQKDIFNEFYTKNKRAVDKDLANYKTKHKIPKDKYDAFIKSLDQPSESKSKFYDLMRENGYNAILDQHDVTGSWMDAYKPLIIMDIYNEVGDMKVSDISDDDVLKSLRRLGVNV